MSLSSIEQSSSFLSNCPIYSPRPIRRYNLSNNYSFLFTQSKDKIANLQRSQEIKCPFNIYCETSSYKNNTSFGTNSDLSDNQDKLEFEKELIDIISNKSKQSHTFTFEGFDDCSDFVKIERPKNPFYTNFE